MPLQERGDALCAMQQALASGNGMVRARSLAVLARIRDPGSAAPLVSPCNVA